MKIKNHEIDLVHVLKTGFCIGIGTASGLFVYGVFLYYHIDIFGWNLGLIFAPLAAGYVETVIANRILGENVGAISAFILFIDTTFYSFILKNPTLGVNIITAGSIIVILQAAFPTLIDYILLVVFGGMLSYPLKGLKKIVKKIEDIVAKRPVLFWEPPQRDTDEIKPHDEVESNNRLNSLDFYFITGTDITDKRHEKIGIYGSHVILDRDTKIIQADREESELKTLTHIKQGKDECLIKLSENVKRHGGNGIVNLKIEYFLVGLGGDCIQISATGMGVYIHS